MAKRKIAEKDFLESDLPQTRKSQFFDIIKINYGLIFKIGLFLLIPFLLIIVKNFFVDYFNILTINAFKNAKLSEEESRYWINMLFISSNAIDIVLYPFLFVFLGGILRVFRQLCFSEGVLFKYLFKKGVKDNWKQFLIIGIFTALFKFGMNALITFFGFDVYSIIVLVFFVVVYLPVIVVYLYYSSIYVSNIFISLRNALYVYLKSLWQVLLFVVIAFALPISLEFFMTGLFIKQSIYIVSVVLLLPLVILAGFLMLLDRFDKTINITEYQTLIRKGLYVSNEELEKYVDCANRLVDKRGLSPESMKNIKEVIYNFAVSGKNITSLQYKGNESYEVIFDKEKHYLLQMNDNNSIKGLKTVLTKEGKECFYQKDNDSYFYLFEYGE